MILIISVGTPTQTWCRAQVLRVFTVVVDQIPFFSALCTVQWLNISALQTKLLLPFSRWINWFVYAQECHRERKCPIYKRQFEVIWQITAMEGTKGVQECPKPTGVKFPTNSPFFHTPPVGDVKLMWAVAVVRSTAQQLLMSTSRYVYLEMQQLGKLILAPKVKIL